MALLILTALSRYMHSVGDNIIKEKVLPLLLSTTCIPTDISNKAMMVPSDVYFPDAPVSPQFSLLFFIDLNFSLGFGIHLKYEHPFLRKRIGLIFIFSQMYREVTILC